MSAYLTHRRPHWPGLSICIGGCDGGVIRKGCHHGSLVEVVQRDGGSEVLLKSGWGSARRRPYQLFCLVALASPSC